MAEVYRDKNQLKKLLEGKTIVDVEGDNDPENNYTIVFSDSTRVSFTCHGDDMSYIRVEVTECQV
jgi:hypothetical protein